MRTLLAACTALLLACQAPAPEQATTPAEADSSTTAAADNSRTALDWAGTYHGTVPCADCQGIDTRITLNADGTYRMETIYLGRSTEAQVTEGSFTWEDDGGRIVLGGVEPGTGRYRVGENVLMHLDRNGERIGGALAERYLLPREAEAGR